MKVQIRDKEALESLTVANLRAYLEKHGWGNERPWGTWATILSKEGGGRVWEVSVPNEVGGLLYAESVAEIIATLAEAEDRSQLDVFHDLANLGVGNVTSVNPNRGDNMTNVWCVRAEFGSYTNHFVAGGYVGLGWGKLSDLSAVKDRDELYRIYEQAYPEDAKSKYVIGQQVGQVARFLFDIQVGDWVITPMADSALLRYGKVGPGAYYYEPEAPDGCPYPHRRKLVWTEQTLLRSSLSIPLQYSLRAAMTVFSISRREDFLAAIGQSAAGSPMPGQPSPERPSTYQVVLERILSLDDKEFEILVGHLLTALGFEGSAVTGKPGDGGVDVTGELNVSNLATVKLFVQAKRYRLGAKITANTVRQLRQAIPRDGQGAFITTAEYHKDASDVASDPNFPRIGLINGHQLVDLLIEHWNVIPQEFRELLQLKHGLVPA